MSETDFDLLAMYLRQGSQEAFAELVRRHLDLVYSAAVRQTRSSQFAEEVAQLTFIKLAGHAHRLSADTVLEAWLYQVARRNALDISRREARRAAREQIASQLDAIHSPSDHWTEIEPLLDEAMDALAGPDRTAVILRYFKGKSLREVGTALGSSEDAAQKRVRRAIEQIRSFFQKRGVALSTSALVASLTTNCVHAAPAGLSFNIATTAAHALGGSSTVGSTSFMTKGIILMTTKKKLVLLAALFFVLLTGSAVVHWQYLLHHLHDLGARGWF